MRHRLFGDLLAINREHTGAALARAWSIIFEVKLNRVLAGLERIADDITISHAALPAIPLEIEQIIGKHRLALEQVEAVSAEATAQGNDHSFSPLNVNTVRPAVALGRGVTRRGRIELSSGKTWYFAASVRNNVCISFNLSGLFAARSLYCE